VCRCDHRNALVQRGHRVTYWVTIPLWYERKVEQFSNANLVTYWVTRWPRGRPPKRLGGGRAGELGLGWNAEHRDGLAQIAKAAHDEAGLEHQGFREWNVRPVAIEERFDVET
jgi:hypothetical protein